MQNDVSDRLAAWFRTRLPEAEMGSAVAFFTKAALRELGIEEGIEAGPVTAREERVRQVREARERASARR